jgi:hypothetical protein
VPQSIRLLVYQREYLSKTIDFQSERDLDTHLTEMSIPARDAAILKNLGEVTLYPATPNEITLEIREALVVASPAVV